MAIKDLSGEFGAAKLNLHNGDQAMSLAEQRRTTLAEALGGMISNLEALLGNTVLPDGVSDTSGAIFSGNQEYYTAVGILKAASEGTSNPTFIDAVGCSVSAHQMLPGPAPVEGVPQGNATLELAAASMAFLYGSLQQALEHAQDAQVHLGTLRTDLTAATAWSGAASGNIGNYEAQIGVEPTGQ